VPNFRLLLEYDGAGFAGWQVQPGPHRTVQGVVQAAVARITSQRVRVVGSGRTDAGVHAEGQVASVAVDTALGADRLRLALNGVLPPDVAVLEASIAPAGFDARRDARSKVYRYAVWNGPIRSPLRASRALCLQRRLDLPALRAAAEAVVGTHDFAGFQAAGSNVRTTERTLLRVEVAGEAGGAVELWFEGTGFLRHMVRNLAGTLLEIGSGRRDPSAMTAILAARDRRLAGPTAPAHALTLIRVRYDSADGSAASA
jgi:tRNA pseudouridine38-40 synthase